MIKSWSDDAWDDFVYWTNQDRKTLKRILKLIDDIDRDPYTGIGKPEELRYELAGYWSRHIDDKNRIVYCVRDDVLYIVQCGSHYRDK